MLQYLCILSCVFALAAMGFTVWTVVTRFNTIQDARERAAQDTCLILKGLIVQASRPAHVAAGDAFINRIGLANCAVYARRVRHGKPLNLTILDQSRDRQKR